MAAGLPAIVFRDATCSVCWIDFALHPPEHVPRVLPCGHRLCIECLGRWQSCVVRCPPPYVDPELCPLDDIIINVPAGGGDSGNGGVSNVLNELQLLLEETLQLPGLSNGFMSQVAELMDIIERAHGPHVLGLLGDTGTGKSTLLNALLGEVVLPARDAGRAVTAVPIELTYRDDQEDYRVQLQLTPLDEFRSEVVDMVSRVVQVLEEQELRANAAAGANPPPPLTHRHPGLTALTVLFGPQLPLLAGLDWNQRDVEELATAIVQQALQVQVTVVQGESFTLQALLEQGSWEQTLPSARHVNDFLSKQFKPNGQMAMVLRRVTVVHNWALLRRGLVLMDLPGVCDAERARGNMAMHALNSIDSIMVLARVGRFMANQTAQGYIQGYTQGYIQEVLCGSDGSAGSSNMGVEERLQTNLYYAHLMVATFADRVPDGSTYELGFYEDAREELFVSAGVDQGEYMRLCERVNSDPPTLELDELLPRLRNMYARLRQSDVKDATYAAAQGEIAAQQRLLRAYVVSATEYLHYNQPAGGAHYNLRQTFRDARETGMVELKEQIERLPDDHQRDLVRSVADALSNLLPLAVSGSGGEDDGHIAAYEQMQEDLAELLDDIQARLAGAMNDAELELHGALDAGLAAAAEGVLEVLGELVGGMRWNTLQAVCRRDGRSQGNYRVRTSIKSLPLNFDLNRELARPVINAITQLWGPMFGPNGHLFSLRLADWRRNLVAAVQRSAEPLLEHHPQLEQVQGLVSASIEASLAQLVDYCTQHTRGIVQAMEQTVAGGLAAAYVANSGINNLRDLRHNLNAALVEPTFFDGIGRIVRARIRQVMEGMRQRTEELVEQVKQQVALRPGLSEAHSEDVARSVEALMARVQAQRARVP